VAGEDNTAFLRRVQAAQLDDFWANFTLAETHSFIAYSLTLKMFACG
jgi:hypothetical protein